MRRRLNLGRLIKEGQQRSAATPEGRAKLEKVAKISSERARQEYARYLESVREVFEAQERESSTRRDLAQRLTRLGIKPYRGGEEWSSMRAYRVSEALRGRSVDQRSRESLKWKVAERDEFYRPIIREIMGSGTVSYRGVAAELNLRRVPTVTGRAPWRAPTVKQLLGRLMMDEGPQIDDPSDRDAVVEPRILELLGKGVTTFKGIARELTAQGCPTATGATAWNHVTVKDVMRRLNLLNQNNT